MSYYDHATLMALRLGPWITPPSSADRTPASLPYQPRWPRPGWIMRLRGALGFAAAAPTASEPAATRRGRIGATRETADAAAP